MSQLGPSSGSLTIWVKMRTNPQSLIADPRNSWDPETPRFRWIKGTKACLIANFGFNLQLKDPFCETPTDHSVPAVFAPFRPTVGKALPASWNWPKRFALGDNSSYSEILDSKPWEPKSSQLYLSQVFSIVLSVVFGPPPGNTFTNRHCPLQTHWNHVNNVLFSEIRYPATAISYEYAVAS